ncbi:hypothetical protein ACPWSR_08380 [Alloiococcus sp. CFN-8]|uniref:hypothetical protein n=1 Tax=Alloiococcus sp. CFN-8 TaxID=3416081 RepID=UPI003CE6E82C
MIEVNKDFYVIERSNGTLWYINHEKNKGITYKIIKNRVVINSGLLLKDVKEGFSLEVLSKEVMAIFYEDLKGNLILHLFNEINWRVYPLLNREGNGEVSLYYKAATYNSRLYLFYSIYREDSGKTLLVYHTVDGNGELSSPRIIDELNFQYEMPFYVSTSEDNSLYILYQRFNDDHELGYRVLKDNSSYWSELYTIDRNVKPFIDLSLLKLKDKIHCLYLIQDEYNLVLWIKDGEEIRKHLFISENNISSGVLFFLEEQLWVLWIEGEYIFATFSLDGGEYFNLPPQGECLKENKVYKGMCKLKAIGANKDLYIREIFFADREETTALVLDDIANIFTPGRNDRYTFYKKNSIQEIKAKMAYKKEMADKDILIKELYKSIEEHRQRAESYEKKLKNVASTIEIFNKSKEELNEGVTYLQDKVITKEKRLNELESLYVEREEELAKVTAKLEAMERKLEREGKSSSKTPLRELFSALFDKNRE